LGIHFLVHLQNNSKKKAHFTWAFPGCFIYYLPEAHVAKVITTTIIGLTEFKEIVFIISIKKLAYF
jgi:hypothetical protein